MLKKDTVYMMAIHEFHVLVQQTEMNVLYMILSLFFSTALKQQGKWPERASRPEFLRPFSLLLK